MIPKTDNFLNPSQILKKFELDERVSIILRKESKSLLDIGFNVGLYSWILHHDYKFQKIEGFECNDKDDALQEYVQKHKNDLKNFESIDSLYKLYREVIVLSDDDLHLTRGEFDQMFHKLRFEENAESHLTAFGACCDYLILCGVLHYFRNPLIAYERALLRMNKGSLVYAVVYADSNSDFLAKGFNAFSEGMFEKLCEPLDVIHMGSYTPINPEHKNYYIVLGSKK